jgi:restriction endonuclease S subunit
LNSNYQNNGIPLLRVADLNNWFVKESNLVFINENLSDSLKKYRVNENDIVVSQRGTIALFSKVTNKFPFWNISANLISIKKSEKINFNYLLTFLNSKYGINQLFRRLSGEVQPKITTDDIKQINIFVPKISKQKEISNLIDTSYTEQENSEKYYLQAEELLLKELGLENFESENKLFSIVNFSDCKIANRIDAEFFQPKFAELISKIELKNAKKLGELVSMQKGFEPGAEAYQEKGKTFIRVSSLTKDGVNQNDQKYLKDDLYQKLKEDFEPKVGEILLTKDATPGIAYVLKDQIEGIISSGILKLKLKTEIEPEYLALVINSLVGKMQAKRDAGGSIIAHWKPEQIKNILIPILPKEIQEKIAELVKKSHAARQKSKQLLAEAKQKVEDLIKK